MNTCKINYMLQLADDTLILGHRNSEWCGHGPELEQDIALTNIALDLLGQARYLYQYAATLSKQDGNTDVTEDTFAYHRDHTSFVNNVFVEAPNGDWGQTILKQFLYSAFQYELYNSLQNSNDEQLAAIAAKALKETTYHLRWSSEWVIRLGDGTAASKQRIEQAIRNVWSYTGDIFAVSASDKIAAAEGYGACLKTIQKNWLAIVNKVFNEATLTMPVFFEWEVPIGRKGIHTEHLVQLLAEMQQLPRTYPDAVW